jgi:hypothetical protein
MTYRISFFPVIGSDGMVHFVTSPDSNPICGQIPMSTYKLVVLSQLSQFKRCEVCWTKYHQRQEKEFAVIK